MQRHPSTNVLSRPGRWLFSMALLASVLLSLAQVRQVQADPGDLDPSFDGDGIVTTRLTDIAPTDDTAQSVVIQASETQPDGKIVLVGYSDRAAIDSGSSRHRYDFAVVRYNGDGSPDGSFGTGGIVTTDLGSDNERASAAATQPDGKIVVVGYASGGSALVRYNSDGSLDGSFGSGGIVFGSYGTVSSVAVQSDGKIVVAGYSYQGATGHDFALVRHNGDGSMDGSFGTGGIVTTALGNSVDWAYSVVLQSDGKIVVAGYSYQGATGYDFAVVRYNGDGSMDGSFGTGGAVTTDLGSNYDSAYSVALQSDGEIVVAGHSDQSATGRDFAVVRYNGDGSLDSGFGSGGIMTTDLGSNSDLAYSVALQSDGKIVVAGDTSGDFALARYNSDGSLDSGFDADGIVTTALGSGYARAYSVVLQSDDKIVAAGVSVQGTAYGDFALARYNGDGSLDAGFGSGGIVTTDIGEERPLLVRPPSVALQPDGKIVIAGSVRTFATHMDIAVIRYNGDGSMDGSFGSGGIVITDLGGYDDNAYSVAIQPDGKIVVAGYSSQAGTGHDFALVRYNADGSLDSTFGSGGIVTTDLGSSGDPAHSVALQSDGKIVVAGSSYQGATGYDFAVVRYDDDGSPDPGFGIGGIAITDLGSSNGDYARSAALQSDGKIVVAGSVGSYATGYDFAVVRYNDDGSLDATFDADGMVTTDLGSSETHARSVALQSDGKIVVAGYSYQGTTGLDFALVRYNGDGGLDSGFGSGGIVTTNLGTSSDRAYSVVLQPDGKIVVAGYSYQGGTGYDFAVARYNGDGGLDSGFGSGGAVTTELGSHQDTIHSVAVQPDGKIVVAGYSYHSATGYSFAEFGVARYEGDDGEPPVVTDVWAEPDPAAVQTDIVVGATVDDSSTGNLNIASAEYSLDGVAWTPMAASDGSFDSSVEQVQAVLPGYVQAGLPQVCVRSTDAAGNTSDPTCITLAVYDPNGGFVTGGGWIRSPAGAYLADPSLEGKANLNFAAKYNRGTIVPIAQTEFQFNAGGLYFSSSSYEWLVITGANAKYKGVGTINGQGEYGFMLTATDADLTSNADVDLFRIQIWDRATDELVYDNQFGQPDDGYDGTEIGGGNIKVHKAKK